MWFLIIFTAIIIYGYFTTDVFSTIVEPTSFNLIQKIKALKDEDFELVTTTDFFESYRITLPGNSEMVIDIFKNQGIRKEANVYNMYHDFKSVEVYQRIKKINR